MIRVRYNYGGSPSGGRRILPGDYGDNDPALFGLADYLVANGHAVRILAASDEPVLAEYGVVAEPRTDDSTPGLDLQAMTVDELTEYAEQIDILDAIEGTGTGGRILKADLVKAIEGAIQ